MSSKRNVRIGSFSLFLAISIFLSSPVVEAEEPAGFEVKFDRDPLWVISGAWNQVGDRLFLVDSARQEIIRVQADGAVLPAISPSLEGTGFSRFNRLRNTNGRLHVDLDSAALAELNDSLGVDPRGITRIAKADFPSTGLGQRIAAVHAWTVLDRHIIAFVDVEQKAVPQWVSGFVKIPIGRPEEFEYLLDMKLSLGDPMVTYYQLGLNLMDSSGTSAFVLVMDDPPYLVTIDRSGTTRTVNVQTACGTRPAIPRIQGGVTALPAVLEALERAEGPIGVYAQENRVFLLCRRWVEKRVQFAVAEVDMVTGAAVFLNPIDTEASHLVAVPGPRYWAFVQKGPVLTTKSGGPFMTIKSTLMVPAKAVVDPKLRSAVNRATPEREIVRLSGRVWEIFKFAFSGIGIMLLSLLFRRARAVWRRAARKLRDGFRGGRQRVLNLKRREENDSTEPIDAKQGS